MKEWLTAAHSAESSSTRSHIENATNNVTRFLPANPLVVFAFGVQGQWYHCSFRTTTRLNARTATRCSRMRRTWDITTKPITSFRIRKRRQHLGSQSLLLQIRFKTLCLWDKHISFLAQEFRMCMHIFIQVIPLGKLQERQEGPSEVPLPHVWHPCHVRPHRTKVLGDQLAVDHHWSIVSAAILKVSINQHWYFGPGSVCCGSSTI